MRTETVLNIMGELKDNNRNFRDCVNTEVIGMTVLTDYNNKTYRIDDIDWTKSPKDEFDTKGGKESFANYYFRRYQIRIRDLNQPLLMSKAKERDIRGGRDQIIALIPELCRVTGLSDKMRNNFRYAQHCDKNSFEIQLLLFFYLNRCTRAMSDYTRMAPDKRIQKLLEFNRRLSGTAASAATLREWDIKLSATQVDVSGRVLNNENIVFGNNKKYVTFPCLQKAPISNKT